MEYRRIEPKWHMTIKCPFCLDRADLDDSWHPPEGYDPLTRRYVCRRCGQVLYVQPIESSIR